MIVMPLIAVPFYVLFMREKETGAKKAVYKCVPGFLTLLTGLWFLLSGKVTAANALIAAGLLICAAADWILEFRFLPGMALFAVAHLCFIGAFVSGGSHGFSTVLYFALLFAAMCTLFILFRNNKPENLPFAVFFAYAAVLALMAAFAFGCNVLIISGALLFVCSDTLLGLRLFGVWKGHVMSWILMGAYYSALFLFAFACKTIA